MASIHLLILDLNSFRELNCSYSSGKILHNLGPKCERDSDP